MIMFWRFHHKNTVVQSNFDLDIRFWKNDYVTPWLPVALWLLVAFRWRALTCILDLSGQLVLRCWASLNMVQTSIHRWGFFFLSETFKKLLVSVYTSQLKEHLSDLISTRLSIWHPLKLFTFIELCYVSYFRWACYSHNHMNQSVRWLVTPQRNIMQYFAQEKVMQK